MFRYLDSSCRRSTRPHHPPPPPPACCRRKLHQWKRIPPKSPIALRILSWRGATVAKSSATILVRFGKEVSHASIRASPTANPKNPAKVLNCCFGCENRVPPRIYRSQHVLQTDLQAVFNQPTWHHSRPIPSSTWLMRRGLETCRPECRVLARRGRAENKPSEASGPKLLRGATVSPASSLRALLSYCGCCCCCRNPMKS